MGRGFLENKSQLSPVKAISAFLLRTQLSLGKEA